MSPHMKRGTRAFVLLTLVALFVASASRTHVCAQERDSASTQLRFLSQINAYRESDAVAPPPKGGILFIGSSIFRRWKTLEEQLSPLPVFNRAFGGSRSGEVLFWMDTLVLPHEPFIIVYYCGSNDINASISPSQIVNNVDDFCSRVRTKLPGTKVIFVSIIRAPEKETKWDAVDQVNDRIRQLSGSDTTLIFVDVNPVFFDSSGSPRTELYLEDGLHLQGQAYSEMSRVLKPVLEQLWQDRPR